MPRQSSSQRRLLLPHVGRGLFFFICLSSPVGCLSQPIPLEKYQADLRQCLESVQQARADPGSAARHLRQARRILPMRWLVARGPEPPGAAVTVPADRLLQELYSAETADKDAAAKLLRLEEELAWLLTESDLDAEPWHAGKAEAARKQLGEILARSEFRRKSSETVLDRLRRWVNYWIGRALLALLPGAVKQGKWIGYFLWGALFLGALLVLYRLVKPLLGRERRQAETTSAEEADGSTPRRSAQQWMAEARAHVEAGDYRRAIRAGYHAGLEFLIVSNLLDYHPSRTNREYLSCLGASARLHAQFSRLTDQFERVWYGWQSCGRPEADVFLAGVSALEAPSS